MRLFLYLKKNPEIKIRSTGEAVALCRPCSDHPNQHYSIMAYKQVRTENIKQAREVALTTTEWDWTRKGVE